MFLASVSQALGPLSANVLAEYVGYNYTYVIGGCGVIVFALIYIIFCGLGPTYEEIRLQENLAKAKKGEEEELLINRSQQSSSTNSQKSQKTKKHEEKMKHVSIGRGAASSKGSRSVISMTGPYA